MSELFNKAVSGESKEAFDTVRKLTACSLSLVNGTAGAVAASTADKTIFQKTVDYAVGAGKMAATEGVDAVIDRGASHLSSFLHKTISTVVSLGCRAAGGWIGHFFGPAGIVVGQHIGAKIGDFLNTNVSTLIEKGVSKVKEVAKTVVEKGKELLHRGWEKIKSLFS